MKENLLKQRTTRQQRQRSGSRTSCCSSKPHSPIYGLCPPSTCGPWRRARRS